MTHEIPGAGRRTLLVAGRPLREPGGEARILVSVRDITEVLQFQVQDRAEGTRFRRLFETSADGLLIADADTGRIRQANQAMASMMECTAEELCHADLSELALSTGSGPLKIAQGELRAKGTFRCDKCVLTSRSGVRRDVDVLARLHDDTFGRIIEVNVRHRTPDA